MKHRWVLFALASLGIAGYGFWLYFGNPEAGGFYPKCVLHSMTGLKCAGCGGQRAVHCLLHGEVTKAFRYNWMALSFWPLFTIGLFLKPFARSSWYYAVAIGVTLVYSFVRNIPGANF